MYGCMDVYTCRYICNVPFPIQFWQWGVRVNGEMGRRWEGVGEGGFVYGFWIVGC